MSITRWLIEFWKEGYFLNGAQEWAYKKVFGFADNMTTTFKGEERMNKTFAERKAEWEDYHRENPMVWEYFQKFSFEAIAKGRSRISHWLIINRIRWEVYIVTTGEEFKISNNYIAFYARLWQKTFPQHKDLFHTKPMLGEKASVLS